MSDLTPDDLVARLRKRLTKASRDLTNHAGHVSKWGYVVPWSIWLMFDRDVPALLALVEEQAAALERLGDEPTPSVVGADWRAEAVEAVHERLCVVSAVSHSREREFAEQIVGLVAALVPRPTIDREAIARAVCTHTWQDGLLCECRPIVDRVLAVLDPDSEAPQ